MDLLGKLSRIRELTAFYQRVANDLSKIGMEKMRESGLLGNGLVNNNLLQEVGGILYDDRECKTTLKRKFLVGLNF